MRESMKLNMCVVSRKDSFFLSSTDVERRRIVNVREAEEKSEEKEGTTKLRHISFSHYISFFCVCSEHATLDWRNKEEECVRNKERERRTAK